MNYRELGETGMRVSEVSLGTWAFGGDWGSVGDEDSLAAMNRAVDLGVNFFDTADVYGDGRSERLVGRLLKERPGDEIFVATKAGRRLDPHAAEGYDHENLAPFVERSLANLGVDALDLLQLHCPPTEVYRQDETFEALDRLRRDGMIRNYGVSAETVEEAKLALAYPGVKTVQIVFNAFRQKPAEEFFPLAEERNIGVLARVPLASGLLSGKMSADRDFEPSDHRNFNRHGEAFDVGETFSGVPFDAGLDAAESPEGTGARGPHAGAAGAALDPDAPRRLLRHPGCQEPGAGREQRGRSRHAPTLRSDDAAHTRGLRRPDPPRGAPPMVNEGGAGRTRVLLTGATGYIAGQLLPEFRERYDLRLTDAREETSSGELVDGVEVVDLLSDDDSKLGPLFDWADVVVHCGHLKPQGEDLDARYEGERRNLDMMHRIYRLSHGAWCAPGGSGEHQPGGQVVREPVLRRPQGPRGPRGLPAPGLLLRLGQGRLGAARLPVRLRARWAASSRSSRSG